MTQNNTEHSRFVKHTFNQWKSIILMNDIFPDQVEGKSMELPNVKDKMKELPCYLHF